MDAFVCYVKKNYLKSVFIIQRPYMVGIDHHMLAVKQRTLNNSVKGVILCVSCHC